MVQWIAAVVIQIDQSNPCEDDLFDAVLPVPESALSFMQASSRRIVGNPTDPLVPYILTAFMVAHVMAGQ